MDTRHLVNLLKSTDKSKMSLATGLIPQPPSELKEENAPPTNVSMASDEFILSKTLSEEETTVCCPWLFSLFQRSLPRHEHSAYQGLSNDYPNDDNYHRINDI